MKMKYWTQRLSGQNMRQAVKLSQLKLELGLFGAKVGDPNERVSIEIMGKVRKIGKVSLKPTAPFSSLLPQKGRCTHTTPPRRFLSKAPSLQWDTQHLCGFHLPLKHSSFHACDVTFHVLYYSEGAAAGESKAKGAVVGKAFMTVTAAELLVTEEMKTESNDPQLLRRLPIQLKVNGLIIQATLSVSLSLLKLSNSQDDSPGLVFENSVESEKKRGIAGKVKYLTSFKKKTNGNFYQATEQRSPYESDGSPVFDSDDLSNESTTSNDSGNSNSRIHKGESGLMNRSDRFTISEGTQTQTRLDAIQRNWSQLPWNSSFKGWSFRKSTRKQETFTTHSGSLTKSDELFSQLYLQDNNCGTSIWENREFSSRDGQGKLKTNVFFASFDQRSEQASGESACTVLVALIARWLHSNQDIMPTREQFDGLITQGSSEWRRLCNNDEYSELFPDKHFDLETVIEANIRPLTVVPQKSYTGFFSPEKFQSLKGAMSFDEIWDAINRSVEIDNEPRIYIVSWNDHFFVLKIEADTYYIIDTLGERLFEGCQRAFILKFDDSSLMYGKLDKGEEEAFSKRRSGAKSKKSEEKSFEVFCTGKQCCKEFIKHFLAAIPVRQLEKEEKKGTITNPNYLHRHLQIEFHHSSSSSSSSTSVVDPNRSLII